MNPHEELTPWYELRDRLRSDFIRYTEEGRPFPPSRQRMLDRVEDAVVQMERLQREVGKEFAADSPALPYPTVTLRENTH